MTANTRDLDRPYSHHDYLPYSTPEACGGRQDRACPIYTRYDLVREGLPARGKAAYAHRISKRLAANIGLGSQFGHKALVLQDTWRSETMPCHP